MYISGIQKLFLNRLADHIDSCDTFSLKHVKFLVLDEADRLINDRFNKQLKTIFDVLNKDKQILLFSATMTDSIEHVKTITTKEVIFWVTPPNEKIFICLDFIIIFVQVFVWKSDETVVTVNELNQYYVLCPNHAREGYLVEVIRVFVTEDNKSSIMIFTDTCKWVNFVLRYSYFIQNYLF